MMSLLAISQSRPALVAEYGHAGTIRRRFIHGPNADADDPYVQFEGPQMGCNGTRFLYADPRGSIVALADCWGNNQAINAYDEFGIPDTATGNDIATKGRFRYTGQAWIPELGMYYYKARIYSPTLGRFLQTDPIGYEDQFNLYAYVANDPINNVDPTGESWLKALKVVGKSLIQGKRPDKVAVDEVVNTIDDIGTIVSDPISLDAAAAVADVLIGTDLNNPKAKAANAASSVQGTKLQKQLASESQVSQIADGQGTVISQPAKQADRIAAQTGGNPADIQKVTSDSFTAKDGQQFETRAFRNATTGEVIEPKTKIIKP